MYLDEGRLEEMMEETRCKDTNVICHSTLDGDHAVCRGSFDYAPGQMARISLRLGLVEYVKPPKLFEDLEKEDSV
jgi:hypothetical protein